MKYKFVALVFVLVCFSCGKVKPVDVAITNTVQDSINATQKITNGIGVLLSEDARLKVADWKEYQKVASLMTELYNTSKSDVLENAELYADEIKFLRDSIRIDVLDNPKIISRINILLNQSLRLKDMHSIPSISNAAVKVEVVKLCASFSSLNSRINTTYATLAAKKDLKELGF
ncbi:MAG: hypothetical protein COB81_07285 [Flavobacteriaceae bacterium]|nr:MAG: hypothetical protein COB81_07285 [Flavobacteriaceae bacterium]